MKSLLLSGVVKSDHLFICESVALWDDMSFFKQTFKGLLEKSAATADWEETNRTKKIAKKYLGRPSKEFEKKLVERFNRKVREAASYSKYVPQWLLLNQMFTLFDVPFPNVEASLPEIDQSCLKLEGLFLSVFAKKEKLGKSIDMVGFFNIYTEKMAESLVENFSKLSRENQDKVLNNMLGKIKDLPEEEKEAFRSSVQIEEITKDGLRKTLLAGGASVGLTSYVSFAGFGAYMLLTQMIASLAGIVGVTLPFGVYASATSLLAVLSNPLTMILFLSGSGLLLEKNAAKKMREELLKGLMAQMIFAAKTRESSWKDTETFVEARKVAGFYVQ